MCDLETSRIGAPYIYAISNLRVNKLIGFLKISTSLHKWLAVKTHLADGDCLKVSVNREGFLELLGRTRIPVISKKDGQYLKHEKKHK